MNSRSLTEENPLYLSQAKVYTGCCALGPGITPVWEVSNPYKLKIAMTVERNEKKVWTGETSTRELRRKLDDLIAYLFREDDAAALIWWLGQNSADTLAAWRHEKRAQEEAHVRS